MVIDYIDTNRNNMAKKKNKTQKQNIVISSKLNQRKEVYQIQNMDRDIREIDTRFWTKYISKWIAIAFTVCFGVIAIVEYYHNTPFSSIIKIGIPISAIFIDDLPKQIISLLKRSPP